jgi:hypothetical protein
VRTPECRLNELCGVDAALYVRFLRGCCEYLTYLNDLRCYFILVWFTFLHTLTTFPVLFPIHVQFSDDSVSRTSMTRASISSLVGTSKGLSLLWIHILMLFWLTVTWIVTLCWICLGAFRLRQAHIYATTSRLLQSSASSALAHSPHPHPPYTFVDSPVSDEGYPNVGLRSRTIMVCNVPRALRDEKALKDYFIYYMSHKVENPSMGWTSSLQPGLLNKCCTFLLNRLKRRAVHVPTQSLNAGPEKNMGTLTCNDMKNDDVSPHKIPIIERVTIARRMTDLASLMERRDEILSRLEAAHIALANNALLSVKAALDRKQVNNLPMNDSPRTNNVMKQDEPKLQDHDVTPEMNHDGLDGEEERMNHLTDTLAPYVEELGLQRPLVLRSKKAFCQALKYIFSLFRWKRIPESSAITASHTSDPHSSSPPYRQTLLHITIWEALLTLPRSSLDAFQPLINLSHLFRGKTVPAIDYYTMKLKVLNARIAENRSKPESDYEPVSTAFVTFLESADAQRACRCLTVHPENPLACLVSMAPAYEDLDWMCVMKSSFNTAVIICPFRTSSYR